MYGAQKIPQAPYVVAFRAQTLSHKDRNMTPTPISFGALSGAVLASPLPRREACVLLSLLSWTRRGDEGCARALDEIAQRARYGISMTRRALKALTALGLIACARRGGIWSVRIAFERVLELREGRPAPVAITAPEPVTITESTVTITEPPVKVTVAAPYTPRAGKTGLDSLKTGEISGGQREGHPRQSTGTKPRRWATSAPKVSAPQALCPTLQLWRDIKGAALTPFEAREVEALRAAHGALKLKAAMRDAALAAHSRPRLAWVIQRLKPKAQPRPAHAPSSAHPRPPSFAHPGLAALGLPPDFRMS